MKLKTIILLVSLPIFSFSQTPCDDINVDFPTSVSTETHFLSEGDTIFTQDTFFVATGIYPFYYQSMTADCDSLVQVSVYAPEVADNFMYLPDTVHFNGIGCENEEFIHCMRFQTDAHSSDTHCSLNGEDIGTIAENGSCFTLFVFGLNSINHFPNDLNSYPLQVLSLWDAFSETEHPSFYVNSPLELLHHIREFVPGARIWLNENNDVVIGDNVEDPDNAISLVGTVRGANGEEWTFNIANFIVDAIIDVIEIPSVSLFLQSGENILEIFDTDTNETKTIIFNYDHSLPEIHADYFTYQMPLGQTAIFPISSDDLCEELVSIENICPELAEDAPVDFTLQEDQKVKFKANELGIGHACYKICEESGRCDTFTLRVDVYLPESEEEIVSPEDSLIIHNLYPNPASSILHFTEPFNVFIQKIIIYNSTGKLVDEIRLNESYIYDLDVSRYAEGLYIAVRHLENKEIFVEKFIVQH